MITSEVIEKILDEHRRNEEAEKQRKANETARDSERRKDVVRRARLKIEALQVFTSDEMALLWPESCGLYVEDWSQEHDFVVFYCPVINSLSMRVAFLGRSNDLLTDGDEDFGIYITGDRVLETHYLTGQSDREAVVELMASTIFSNRVKDTSR